jgi:hypothetical protein
MTVEPTPAPQPRWNPQPTQIQQRLDAMRSPGGIGIGKKDLKAIMRAGDGISLMNQAPKTSSDTIAPLQHMLRRVPTTRRQPRPQLEVGDHAPDFSLVGTNGTTVSLADFVGVKPFAMRLTRAAGSGII